jgi:hypothetical protein
MWAGWWTDGHYEANSRFSLFHKQTSPYLSQNEVKLRALFQARSTMTIKFVAGLNVRAFYRAYLAVHSYSTYTPRGHIAFDGF